MTTLLTVAWRDLRGAGRHLRLFAACLILGVGVMACIGSLIAGIKAGIQRDAKALIGGDVEIRQLYTPVEDAALAYLQTQGEVSRTMDMRTMAEPFTPSPQEEENRILVELKAVDNAYPLYGELQTEPPLPREALFAEKNGHFGAAVDAAVLDVLQLKPGDLLSIGEQAFEIRAVIVREPDKGLNAFSFGLRVMTNEEGFRATGLMVYGSMVNHRVRLKMPQINDLDNWKAELAQRFTNASVWNIRDHRESSPAFNSLLDRLSLFFSLTGLTTLITGGIGIGNAVSAYLGAKRMGIATLKCLGATSRRIYAIYLLQLLISAAVAVFLGVLLGVAAQHVLAGALQSLLPAQAEQGFYVKPLLISAAFGLLTVLLFSVVPLYRTSLFKPAALFRGESAMDTMALAKALSPERAGILGLMILTLCCALFILMVAFTGMVPIPLYFTLGMAGALLAFCGIAALAKRAAKHAAHLGRFVFPVRMALSNISRPGSATVSVMVALGISLSLLVALTLVQGNLRNQLASELPEKAPALFLLDIATDQMTPLAELVKSVPGVRDITYTPMLRGRITALNGKPAAEETIAPEARWAVRGDRGITWAEQAPANAKLVKGKWWPRDYRGAPLVSFDARLARGMGLDVGDTITVSIIGQEVTATIANLRDINYGTLEMNFATILSPGALDHLPAAYLATVSADTKAESNVQRLLHRDYGNVSVIRVRDALKTFSELLDQVSRAVLATSGLTLISGALVMASAMRAALARRAYDTVMLKVLGLGKRVILRIYMLEFMLLAAGVALLALIIGGVAAYGVMQLMIFSEFHLMPGVAAGALGLALLLALLIGWVAITRALSVRPLALLRNE